MERLPLMNLKFDFRSMFGRCFIGLTGFALRLLPKVPTLEIFNWWYKEQHTHTILLPGPLLCRSFELIPLRPAGNAAAQLCNQG